MKRSTVIVVLVLAALLIAGGLASRAMGDGTIARWIAAQHGR